MDFLLKSSSLVLILLLFYQFVLQKEKQEAERKRVEAQGIADYQRIISSGLTDKQLQYESIQAQLELAKSQNSKVIIMGGKNTPFIISDK